MRFALIMIGLALISNSYAEKSLTVEDIDNLQAIDKALGIAEQAIAEVNSAAKDKRHNCMKALGHEGFCNCLFDKIPYIWDFDNYIAITTKSKDENRYDQLEEDYKKAYDAVIPIRDQCVTELKF